MSAITIELPEGLERSVQLTRTEFEGQVRLMAALKMFELGKLSSGAAAQLAGMSRQEFIEASSRYGIPVADMEEGELEAELKRMNTWVKQLSPTPAP